MGKYRRKKLNLDLTLVFEACVLSRGMGCNFSLHYVSMKSILIYKFLTFCNKSIVYGKKTTSLAARLFRYIRNILCLNITTNFTSAL